MKSRQRGLGALCGVLLLVPLLAACDEKEQWSSGDLRGYNHTNEGINWFSVNDEGRGIIGGNTCCVSLPSQWRPGLKARVKWEVDPNPHEDIPMQQDGGFGYEKEAYARHAANYKRYSSTVDIPDYGNKKCGLTVHFLPCHQIKVTATCLAPHHPDYPVDYPKDRGELAQCPK